MRNQVALNALTIVALGLSAQAFAYQAEINGSYMNTDYSLSDVDTYQIGGEFYVDGVQANAGPFFEAAFLDQATSFRGAYLDNDVADGVIVGGRYVDKSSGMLFEADILTGDLDGFEIGIGMYLDSNSTVTASFAEVSDITDGYGVEYKNLITQHNGTYINLEGGVSFFETDITGQSYTEFSIGGDYYFDKTISVGANIDVASGDTDFTTLGIDAALFLAQNITLEAALQETDIDGTNNDGTSLMFGGKMRF